VQLQCVLCVNGTGDFGQVSKRIGCHRKFSRDGDEVAGPYELWRCYDEAGERKKQSDPIPVVRDLTRQPLVF
jgi:hypothetical protein